MATHRHSDSDLIARLKTGEKRAIHEWFRLYSPKLRAFFVSRVAHESDVDELTQDTFLSCLSSLPLFRGTSSLYTWMIGIARHELADYYRKYYAKKAIRALPLGEHILDAFEHPAYFTGSDAQRVLAHLPAAMGELLQQKYIDQLSVETIAVRLNTSVRCVEGKLYRARIAFRKAYEEIEEEAS